MSAMLRAIAEYYALPGKKALSNGKFSRHAKFGRPRAVAEAAGGGDQRAPDAGAATGQRPRREFWRRLHEMCLEFAKSRLPDFNDEQIEPTCEARNRPEGRLRLNSPRHCEPTP